MQTITKALVTVKDNQLSIKLVELSVHIPINRYLDTAGFYAFEPLIAKDYGYIITYLKEEKETLKSKVLFTKLGQTQSLESVTSEDLEGIEVLAKSLMKLPGEMIQ